LISMMAMFSVRNVLTTMLRAPGKIVPPICTCSIVSAEETR
jgi:hypothetical protein